VEGPGGAIPVVTFEYIPAQRRAAQACLARLESLARYEYNWTEREVPRLPLGFRSLLRPWWRTLSAFRSCDAVVFGGGSLFTDTESVKACFLWGWHAWMARVFHKPIILAFQGIGPFRTKMGEGVARRVVQWASFVSVRDDASFVRVRSLGKDTKIVQSWDPAILLMDEEKMPREPKNVFTVIPRGNIGEDFYVCASEVLQNDFNPAGIAGACDLELCSPVNLFYPYAHATAPFRRNQPCIAYIRFPPAHHDSPEGNSKCYQYNSCNQRRQSFFSFYQSTT